MRLIDADALLKRKGCAYDSEGHLLYAVGTGDIVHAPTIDAIPVEWMKAQIIPHGDKLKNGVRGVFNATIKEMIYRWYQEQEAR